MIACERLRPVAVLRHRAEFLRLRGGRRWSDSTIVIETRPREPIDAKPARVGYTVTKQIGNAVVRNRVRRRLREAMRLCDRALLRGGHDYVLIGRAPALHIPFGDLRAALARGLSATSAARGKPKEAR